MSTVKTISTAAGFAALLLTSFATAQEKKADIEAYCVQKYGTGAKGTFDRRDNGPMCSEKTSQGLGLLHHKLDPAEICNTLHGVSKFRQEGPYVFCITSAVPSEKNDKVDLAAHCRDSYGKTAILSRRLIDNKPLCTVKGSGGLSQIHYPIDLAELCGSGGTISPAAVDGEILDCSKAQAGPVATAPASDNEGPANGKPPPDNDRPSEPKRPRGLVEVPDDAIIPITDNPDLTGCGFARGIDLMDLTANIPDPPNRWEIGAAPTPCPALKGGFKPDLKAFCKSQLAGDGTFGLLPDGRPICHPENYFPPVEDADGYWAVIATACRQMYPHQDDLRRAKLDGNGNYVKDSKGNYVAEGRLIPVVKFTGGELECFYMDVGTGASDEYKVEFISAEAPYDVITRLVTGTSFRVRLIFEKPQSKRQQKVSVVNNRSGQKLEIFATRTRDTKIFITVPIAMAKE